MDNSNNSKGFWSDVLLAWEDLKVCRFGVIVALIGGFIFWKEDQGIEVLRALGEKSLAAGPFAVVKFSAAILGALAWSLAGWYSCRVLLRFDFSHGPNHAAELHAAVCWRRKLTTHIPRLIGVAPLLILARGFWIASGTYDAGAEASGDDPVGWLHFYTIVCLLGAAALYGFFALYRYKKGEAVVRAHRRLSELTPGTVRVLLVTILLSVVLFALFAINPIIFGGGIGTAAVLLLAGAWWVFWGGAAIYLGERYRFPVIWTALALVALFSCVNDNHIVREDAKSAAPQEKSSVAKAFGDWYANVEKKAPGKNHPLFIVASEGGGIRAAYWTATVLATLEDESVKSGLRFSDHLFAISGVSGGSVGASVFDAALASHPNEPITPMTQAMLGRDFLAPVMASMLFPDLAQRGLPYPFPALDRGQWLEKGWERASRIDLKTDLFADDFDRLWAPESTHRNWLPALFLNGTMVETGQPIIASNLAIDNGFLGALDLSDKIVRNKNGKPSRCELPLSVATHGSARFTYVSPAGRFPDGTHIVDGGYFENSGCSTAIAVMNSIRQAMQGKNFNVTIRVIMISNDPSSTPEGGAQLQLQRNSMSLEAAKHKPSSFLIDALAPAEALANTRDAHNAHAQALYFAAVDYQPANFFYFGLSPSKIPLPLGWMLSGSAVNEMNRQMQNPPEPADGKDNPAAKSRLLELLK